MTALGQIRNPLATLKDKGAIFSFQLRHPSVVADRLRLEGRQVSDPIDVRVLVDTGATISAIENSAARRLGLTRTGTITLAGVGGVTEQPVYAAAVDFPGLGISSQDPVRLAGADLGSRDFEFLLGRDVLERLVFEYDGPASAFAISEAGSGARFSIGPSGNLLVLGGAALAGWLLLRAVGVL
jgi:predicted aspartyl protease